jgi:hypothetical protein
MMVAAEFVSARGDEVDCRVWGFLGRLRARDDPGVLEI